MYRSLLPLILASLGFLMIPFGIAMPLFEWQVNQIVTDFPSTYDVKISPSPWKASIGEALDDGSYILQEVRVVGGEGICLKDNLKFVVRRSKYDEIIERVLNANLESISLHSWSFAVGFWELILCGWYIWWFIIVYKYGSALQAVICVGIGGLIYVFLISAWRLIGPHLFGYGGMADCSGAVTFNAKLSKVHFETLLVFGAAVLLELGAFVEMVRHMIKAVTQGKESSKLAAG